MADDKKVKKTKKKKEEEPAATEAPAPAPAPVAEPAAPKRSSTRASKKAVRSGSNPTSMFSDKQVAEFKEVFNMMDADKDGVINKSDLRTTFEAVGRFAQDSEVEDMLKEATSTLNFTTFLTLFANRMSGSADDDEVVIGAFKSFDDGGKIDGEKLRHALTTWGEKFSADEVDEAFEQFEIDGSGRINTQKLIQMLTASAEDEEGEGEAD